MTLFAPLDETELSRIHEESVKLLSNQGVDVADETARDRYSAGGCEVSGTTVRIPEPVLEQSIDRAPESFTLHTRNGDAVVVGKGEPVFAPAFGPTELYTEGDGFREATLADVETFARLAHEEDVVDCAGYNVCEPVDVPEPQRARESMKRTLLTTDLPVVGSAYGRRRSQECLELAGIAADDPDLTRPRVLGQVSPVSPRRWPEAMAAGLLTYAARGQPVIVMSQPLAGASAPATLAGAVILANAEILSGIVLAQLENPGTPVVYGSALTALDMETTSIAAAAPEAALGAAATAQLARSYNLPSRGGGGVTDAKRLDDQAGSESMLGLLAGIDAGIDFTLHAVGILDSYRAVSPEKFLLDCERIRAIRRIRQGIDVTGETIAGALLAETSPDGDFLSARHTVKHARKSLFRPDLAVRDAGDSPNVSGRSAVERAQARVETLLDRYEPPAIDPSLRKRIESYDGHDA
ncbi:Trimethylamine:corrinoid methyltransferase [Halalkaliarchaeum sp. AArc-CO]|uniref:trimethylamine methyltransferase family protein n=1 Tax=unclassified Halalkaliarchaeum TaxID=2678344 RepID=UPI00217E3A35|nr:MULTISPECIES: trimethylamine methyltransferase family protein [unclassified Halalkaliarchaeum]MDR5672358.1 trimethylamine methyltransferase family protein [Halalkaliarchaeum sp. AArc-GB]UWG50020.1 Trimethylamine:corrinoid methyltransferase [Halalkaliarchaeum sp. AArc-CO]